MCGYVITGEVILPIITPNNVHRNTGIEHMTQIEIKQSKYGPHRYSNSSDDVDNNLPSTPSQKDNSVTSSSDDSPNTRKFSTTSHLRVCCLVQMTLYCRYGNR